MLVLQLCLFLPVIGSVLILLFRKEAWTRWIAMVISLFAFVFSFGLLLEFDISRSDKIQFLYESSSIFSSVDIKYIVGIDGLSILLVLLTTFLFPLVIAYSWKPITKNIHAYYSLLLLLETASLGVFVSFDLLFFYVFFELGLIPMFFLIAIWGGAERIQATMKFFIYTLFGSLFLLVGFIYLGVLGGQGYGGIFTSDLRLLSSVLFYIAPEIQWYIFLAIGLGFAIKIPLFPFHTWLPYAHTEAPTAGSVILAAVMLKMGAYGFLRVGLPTLPTVFVEIASIIAVLSIIGIIYGALIAMVQKDIKKLIAYSSVSHLGFIILGVFSLDHIAMQGAIIQMINHGISTGALFLLVGLLYDQTHSRLLSDYGGLASVMPKYAFFFSNIYLCINRPSGLKWFYW